MNSVDYVYTNNYNTNVDDNNDIINIIINNNSSNI